MSSDREGRSETFCYYHPRRPAFVRCGACGKALCGECIHHGPVGARCVECLYGVKISPVSRRRRAAAGAAALVTALGVAGGLGYLGFLNWLTGIILGLLAGQAAKTVARRIPAPSVQAGAGMAAAIGAYGGALVEQARLLAQAGAPAISLARAAAHVGLGDWALAGLLAAGVAIYWVWRG